MSKEYYCDVNEKWYPKQCALWSHNHGTMVPIREYARLFRCEICNCLSSVKHDHPANGRYVYRGCQQLSWMGFKTGRLMEFEWRNGTMFPAPIVGGQYANVSCKPEGTPINFPEAHLHGPLATLNEYNIWKNEAMVDGGYQPLSSGYHSLPANVHDHLEYYCSVLKTWEKAPCYSKPGTPCYDQPRRDVNYPPKKTKVYFAGAFSKRHVYQDIRSAFQRLGFDVVASWIDKEPTSSGGSRDNRMKDANEDLADIDSCDVLLIDSNPSSKGGMIFEMGYAKAKGKRIYVVGTDKLKDMVFSSIVGSFPSWSSLLYDHLQPGGKL